MSTLLDFPASRRRLAANAAQRGVVLIVALVVLVVMSLAGLLMFRAGGTGVGIAGNIGFKQGATSMADLGIEAGRSYLTSFTVTAEPLYVDHPDQAYYATWQETFNATKYDWDATGASKEAVALDARTGNRVRYVIHRLCKFVGASSAPGQECAIPDDGSAIGCGGSGASPLASPCGKNQPYYRITSRVDGPRGTVSYVQVILF